MAEWKHVLTGNLAMREQHKIYYPNITWKIVPIIMYRQFTCNHIAFENQTTTFLNKTVTNKSDVKRWNTIGCLYFIGIISNLLQWRLMSATRLFLKANKIKNSSTLLFLSGGNPAVTGGFPSQRASNAERVSMPWRLSCAISLRHK